MAAQRLEQFLADLPRAGTLVKDRGYRQVWKFEFEGRGYYLKFYPRKGAAIKRLLRGSLAGREFARLVALQKAQIAAPRAVAQLVGFTINGVKGDAVILQAIEPAIPLDQYVQDFSWRGEAIPDHGALAAKIRYLLRQLRRAALRHSDLHLGNLLLREGEIFLLDGYAVRLDGLKAEDVFNLGHSVSGIATRSDLWRTWEELGFDGPVPSYNPASGEQWRKILQRTTQENDYFGRLKIGPWSGVYFKRYKYPRRWAPASDLRVAAADWQDQWPRLWRQIESGELAAIKSSRSGDVLTAQATLGGRGVSVVIKRPYRRHWYRYVNEIGRGSRAWRAWNKGWNLIVRDLPTAWPLLVMQKRQLGYITDAVIVFERVQGSTLADVDLDAMEASGRQMLFRRAGGMLRRIDQLGMFHYDAKASNWIVREDPKLGPVPILIDVDGIRFGRWPALGIERLLRSMRDHRQYTPADSLALCQGYAPFSRSVVQSDP